MKQKQGRYFRNVLGVGIVQLLMVLSITGSAYGLKFGWGKSSGKENESEKAALNLVGFFFKDAYAFNGFQYAYPEGSRVSIVRGKSKAHNGNASVLFDLVASDYSGGSICLNEKTYDFKKFTKKGALQFWVKGAQGGEKAWVALVDDDKIDGHKTVVRLEVDWFGAITDKWSLVSIPLEHFGKRGMYWDPKAQREVDEDFDWERVAEFRIEIKKGENKSFRIWVDDIQVVKSLR